LGFGGPHWVIEKLAVALPPLNMPLDGVMTVDDHGCTAPSHGPVFATQPPLTVASRPTLWVRSPKICMKVPGVHPAVPVKVADPFFENVPVESKVGRVIGNSWVTDKRSVPPGG
jgi:hypothetical protein